MSGVGLLLAAPSSPAAASTASAPPASSFAAASARRRARARAAAARRARRRARARSAVVDRSPRRFLPSTLDRRPSANASSAPRCAPAGRLRPPARRSPRPSRRCRRRRASRSARPASRAATDSRADDMSIRAQRSEARPPLRFPADALLTSSCSAISVRLVLLLVVAGDERAPRLGLHRALGLPHHVELAVGLHFADEHRLVQVVVLLVHLRGDARGRLEGLAAPSPRSPCRCRRSWPSRPPASTCRCRCRWLPSGSLVSGLSLWPARFFALA